jgi:hypothetical protein
MSVNEASSKETKISFIGQKWSRLSRNGKRSLILFGLSLVVYLLTRFIALPDFPIYFFTDEAVQSQLAVDFIQNGFRSQDGTFLPTYFENGGQYEMSLSVYVQVIPMLIFGKSIWVTRGVSALITVAAAIFLGLILKHSFKDHYWWFAPLLLSSIPAWFLHSRTAFEMMIMSSMVAGFLYFYLRYREGRPKSLLWALVFGALAFYAYSPGQVIIVATGLMLLIADAKYHWQNKKMALVGLGLLAVLVIPYLRFAITKGSETVQHLTILNSYWVKPIPLYEKILTYLLRYLKGLNPIYWFWPNPSFIERLFPDLTLPSWLFSYQNDLIRHTMKGYGHILWITLPFWVIGLIQCIKRFKKPPYRTILFATLAAPTGAAIVDWNITRGMVFIIPATLIITIGFSTFFKWLISKWQVIQNFMIAPLLFAIFTVLNFWMLSDALVNGPTWYSDYGMYGMQYGAQQVFTRAVDIALAEPDTTIYVSSVWTNGTGVVMRYFTDDLPNIEIANINAWGYQVLPLNDDMIFVMTNEDLEYVYTSRKFTKIRIEDELLYPDGTTGFYFVRLEYVDDIDIILSIERFSRQIPEIETIEINGISVEVKYPILDINEIQQAFDGDPTTLVRSLEANPLRLILNFPVPVQIKQVTVVVGGAPTTATAGIYYEGEPLDIQSVQVESALVTRELQLNFSQSYEADELRIEILNTNEGEIAHVHLWEVTIE